MNYWMWYPADEAMAKPAEWWKCDANGHVTGKKPSSQAAKLNEWQRLGRLQMQRQLDNGATIYAEVV